MATQQVSVIGTQYVPPTICDNLLPDAIGHDGILLECFNSLTHIFCRSESATIAEFVGWSSGSDIDAERQ
ncbi:MAG TPA: hypothetical protein VKU38_18225 [Ktedonobacteraceae bacterium]|nr:hypothetical protein [Ktedonobacteraceae bacterium]